MSEMHEIDYQIFGDDMQYVEVELDPGEATVAEAGVPGYEATSWIGLLAPAGTRACWTEIRPPSPSLHCPAGGARWDEAHPWWGGEHRARCHRCPPRLAAREPPGSPAWGRRVLLGAQDRRNPGVGRHNFRWAKHSRRRGGRPFCTVCVFLSLPTARFF